MPHAVADEEDGPVVADNVIVALLGVKLEGEAPRVAEELWRVQAVDDSGEANGEGSPLAIDLRKVRHTDIREVGRDREHTCSATAQGEGERGGGKRQET